MKTWKRTLALTALVACSCAPQSARAQQSNTGSPVLPPDSGALNLGETPVGEPVVGWYKVQQPITSLTASSSEATFTVALVGDTGSGHGTLSASSFAQTVTANCNNCWLGVQFLSTAAGPASASLTLLSDADNSSHNFTLSATALPSTGILLTPMAQDFGSVAVHSVTSPLTFVLTNLAAPAAAATISSATAGGDFLLVPNAPGEPACSGPIAPTASCFLHVAFAPAGTGSRGGLLTIVSPGGTVLANLTGMGTPDPGVAISPTSLTFSSVAGAAATRQTVTLKNTSSSTITFGSATVSDPSFSINSTCGAVAAGALCSLTVTFAPQSAPVSAVLSIPATAAVDGRTSASTYAVALSGTYTTATVGLQILANQADFGAAMTGAMGSTRTFTLNNLTAKQLTVTFALPPQFPLASAAPCQTLGANGSCTFAVSFLPVAGGAFTGTVVAHGAPVDGSATVRTLAYTQGYGTASGSLAITGETIPNTPLNFGELVSGQSVQQVLTLTNHGAADLAIRRITSEPPFLSTSTCALPLVPNATCSITITYAPVDEVLSGASGLARTDVGNVAIESDAATSPDNVALTGLVLPLVSSNPSTTGVISAYQLSEGALTFPNTQVGNISPAQVVALTNTGTTTLHLLAALASRDFASASTCGTFAPNANCNLTITFRPTTLSTSSVRSGTIELLSDAGTSLDFITLVGTSTPAALTLDPAALDFGTVGLGASDKLSVTVTNTAASPVTFLGLAATGDYSVGTGTCPATGTTLAAGESCALVLTFKPAAAGTRTGSLSLTNDASQLPLTVALTGIGVVAQLTVTPGALAFPNTDVGFPTQQTLTLLNAGAAPVTGIANTITGANAGDFAVTVPCSVTTLAPNQGCTETVTFTPAAVGARAATLSIASSDPKGPAVIALSGTGIAAGSFTLTVSGGSAATATVASGTPATYALLLTPSGGFTGAVALTCTPLTAGEYMTCSLLASQLTLGSTALTSTATLNTITSEPGGLVIAMFGVMLPFVRRKRRSREYAIATSIIALFAVVALSGCGGGGASISSNVRTTPPGTYRYVVTANSTSGAPVSSSVTLTLVVQ